MEGYWNHNTAYHDEIVQVARRIGGRVLDVGCGDGLLVQRLAAVSAHVTGIDPDPAAVAFARERTSALHNVTLVEADFLTADAGRGGYDLVTFGAALHHMDLAAALRKAADALRPGGEILVVGLAANRSATDWVVAGLCLPVVRVMDRVHGTSSPPVPLRMLSPRESIGEIRTVAAGVIPGASVRRRLYYRYVLRWTRPA